VVQAASRSTSPQARAALESLCTTYGPPVHAYIRRCGYSTDDAADRTQAFFARVIEKGDVGHARYELGRFRTFLLTAVRHFLLNQADHDRAADSAGACVRPWPTPCPTRRTLMRSSRTSSTSCHAVITRVR